MITVRYVGWMHWLWPHYLGVFRFWTHYRGWSWACGPLFVDSIARERPCRKCGYMYPENLGRYGCPNCHGEGLKCETGV